MIAAPTLRAARAAAAAPTPARRRIVTFALAVIVTVSFGLTVAASRTTSTTFDEIIMMAGGARGFETGHFDLAPEHPPLTQYLYGLPIFLDGATYPVEPGGALDFGYRYRYSRQFFWGEGNDPERMAFLGRLPAALAGALTVLLAFAFARRLAGSGAGLFAAGLVAFLPDLLAHGGVAYNDLPLATMFLASVWAFDRAARTPGALTGALAGVTFALATAIKFSAVALLPVALLLLVLEGVSRREGRVAWLRGAGLALAAAAVAAYALLVIVYRGDVLLAEFRYGLDYTFSHVGLGHGAPAYLLGEFSQNGWWYFFPLAFLYKTPAALHLLAVLALLGYAAHARAPREGAAARDWRALLASPLRAPIAGILVFGYALVTSSLNIGFRYALPVLPLLCILIAVGLVRTWHVQRPLVRAAIVACALWYAGGVAAHHPHYLSYISEYGPGDGRADRVLLDSSVDWGQGLLALRGYMREHGIDRVYLSYFGSADPAGYGIDFVPLPSFFPFVLPAADPAVPPPLWAAVSATNVHGVYLPGDPMAQLRDVEPEAIIANSIFLYRINE